MRELDNQNPAVNGGSINKLLFETLAKTEVTLTVKIIRVFGSQMKS